MSLKKSIQVAGLKILEVAISPQDSQWGQVSILAETYGAHVVLEAFESWANLNKERLVPYPLSEFVRVAPRMVSRVSSATAGPSVDEAALDGLCSELYLIGGPAFSGKHREVLATLLGTYAAGEIKDAYTEFIANFDDFELKTATKKFAEGGGKAVLLAMQKRQEQLKQQEELIERTKQQMLEAHTTLAVTEEEPAAELPEV